MLKRIVLSVCAALAAVFSAHVGVAAARNPRSPEALAARAYVQDGLVLQFDAIENAGRGTHDSSATTWTELVSGVENVNLYDATWSADGVTFASNVGYGKGTKHNFTSVNRTLEGYITIPESVPGFYFGWTRAAGDKNRPGIWKSGGNWYMTYFTGGEYAPKIAVTQGDHFWSAAECTSPGDCFFQLDDEERLATSSCGSSSGTTVCSLRFNMYGGASDGASGIGGDATYRAFRVYSRALTHQERCWNRAVDRFRFGGEDVATAFAGLTPPPGISGPDADGNFQVPVTITGFTDDKVLSLDGGETWFASTNGWLNLSSEQVLTVREDVRRMPVFSGAPVTLRSDGTVAFTVSGATSLTAALQEGGKRRWNVDYSGYEYAVTVTNLTGEAVLSLDGGASWFAGTNFWAESGVELAVTLREDVRRTMVVNGPGAVMRSDGSYAVTVAGPLAITAGVQGDGLRRWNADYTGYEYRVRVTSNCRTRFEEDEFNADTKEYWIAENATVGVAVQPADSERVAWAGVPEGAAFAPDGLSASFAVTKAETIHIEAFAPTHVWTGGVDTDFANLGNWVDASGEAAGAALDENACVYIPVDATRQPTVSASFTVGALYLGSLVRGSGAATLTFSHRDMNQVVGNCYVLKGGVITHTALPTNANTPAEEKYRVALSVGGDMVVDKDASVDADSKGYASQKGPGIADLSPSTGDLRHRSAAHGGSCYAAKCCYGSLTCPTNSGSGSNTIGGGAIRLAVTGDLMVNGTVSARSEDYDYSYRSGAGGSIWLTCARLAGMGSLDVTAGTSSSGSGGGGRIAVHLAVATDFSDWRGKMYAHGGKRTGTYKNNGGAGTIYLQANGQTPETATVIVDNAGGYYTDGKGGVAEGENFGFTLLSDRVGAAVVGNLIVTNHARVAFGAAGEFARICGDIDTTTGEILAYEGTAELAGDRTQTIRGNAAWDDLKCTVPGKTIRIGTAPGDALNFRATSVVTLSGSEDSHLVLTPAVAGETWKMMLPVGALADVSYVTVDHSDASGVGVVGVTAKNSTDGGDNTNWSFPKPMSVGDPVTWTGAIDSDWNKAGNWKDKHDDARLPTADDKVIIPPGCENWPRVPSEMSFWGLVVDTNAQLTIAGGPLSITNELRVAGTLAFSGYQTLKVSAPTASFADGTVVPGEGTVQILDGADTLDPGNCTFCRVEISMTGGSLVLADGLKARSFEVRATDDSTLTFAAGKTIAADTVVCSCMESGKYLTLQSSAANEKWFLKSPRISYMTGISVSDSTATDAAAVASLSENVRESNVNWVFDNGVSEWVGGANGKFDVAANWYPAGVPGVTNDVIVRGAAEITADGNVSVRSLALLPDEKTASLLVKGVLNTVADAVVGTNATLTLTTARDFNEIGGDVVVQAGGTVTHPELSTTATTLADGENGAKVLLRAKNVVIEKGGKIDAVGKGYCPSLGPGGARRDYVHTDGKKYNLIAAHAGCGVSELANTPTTNPYFVSADYRAYGSMFEPVTYGSGGDAYMSYSTRGGGVIRLVATGDVTVDGEVRADGGEGIGFTGAGGSVWITAGGTFAGGASGVVSAAGGSGGNYHPGSGGRIAVYAAAKTFAGTLTTSVLPFTEQKTPESGTVLVKLANSETYSLEVDYDKYTTMHGGAIAKSEPDEYLVCRATDIPTAEDLDKLDLFKRTSVTCGRISVLNLTRDLKLYDLDFTASSGSKARLNLHTLKLLSSAHKKGKGWAVAKQGDDPIATHIWPCEKDGAKGKVVWSAGMLIMVR